MKKIVRESWLPVAAILGLMTIAVAVGGYILNEQRVRFPFFEPEPMRLNVEFPTAQAVTPGQGQTVQVAGVKIGTIADVKLDEGRAIVGMDIEPKYDDLIRTDARALLRPRTPLRDMLIQVDPGKAPAPLAKEGFTIPVERSLPDVDLPEILQELDKRTRDYVVLLANGTGTGLKGNGKKLAQVFERFGPTFRDLARVNRSVARERVALRRLVTSLAQINGQLAKKPEDLSQLVESASATFGAFASEDDRLRDTIGELPPTLQQATRTLEDVRPLARELGPATAALVPAFRALNRANRAVRPFARESTPIVREQIRPFARTARPLVQDLAPAARDLSATFPELTRDLRVLNRLFNMLGHNPGGREGPEVGGGNGQNREEGYLFWLAWVTHQTVNLLNVDDANGPMRPLFLTGTCSTLVSLVEGEPGLEFAMNLSPVLATVCGDPDTRSVDTRRLAKRGAR